MTNQEILEKVIQKAIEGGWSWIDFFSTSTHGTLRYKGTIDLVVGQMLNDNTYPALIFNHDFAKALWGVDSWTTTYPEQTFTHTSTIIPMFNAPTWQHHLQQMVIAEDPITYLGENI